MKEPCSNKPNSGNRRTLTIGQTDQAITILGFLVFICRLSVNIALFRSELSKSTSYRLNNEVDH